MKERDRFRAALRRIRPIEARVRAAMLRDHEVAEGCWGVPAFATPTFTRGEFYRLALDAGAMTPDEFEQVRSALGPLWSRDLSD